MSLLLSTDKSRIKLEQLLASHRTGTILTAFFSEFAERWLSGFEPERCTVVIRGQVTDFLSGASSTKAIRNLLEHGHSVSIKLDLHAKLFWFGDEMLVGSSNLTGNGFNLIERGGNIELNSIITATHDNVGVVQNIIKTATELDIDTLTKMEDFLATSATQNSEVLDWPTNLMPVVQKKLSVLDLPRLGFTESAEHDLELWGNIARSQLSGNYEQATNMIENADVFDWLLIKIDEVGERGLRFGAISSFLHDELYADPALFRSEIKDLQQNLYSFLMAVNSKIELSVPGARSQVLKRR